MLLKQHIQSNVSHRSQDLYFPQKGLDSEIVNEENYHYESTLKRFSEQQLNVLWCLFDNEEVVFNVKELTEKHNSYSCFNEITQHTASSILKKIKTDHPRLLMNSVELEQIIKKLYLNYRLILIVAESLTMAINPQHPVYKAMNKLPDLNPLKSSL